MSLAWIVGLTMIVTHRIFVTNDSINNYVHVWYVDQRLWHGHGIPLHMPVLGHGDAFAFPYGFIPWLSAAVLRPFLGDWIVTLWLVAGMLGVVATQWWAFPELRGGWWTALLLANPMLVEGPLLGQLPFLWALAMLFAAIACWRADRAVAATVLLGLCEATHPAVMLPIVGPLVVARLVWEPRRARLLVSYGVSLVIAAPAIWLVLASPTVSDSSTRALLGSFFGTVSLRALAAGAPFIGLAAQRTPLSRIPALVLVGLVVLNVALVPVRHNEFGWRALVRSPDESLVDFIESPQFDAGGPDRTWRILRVGDGKIGMYQLLQAGAYLDSEPFPESIARRSWRSEAEYTHFLRERKAGYVIVYSAYDRRYGTNEHHLLSEMAAASTRFRQCSLLVDRTAEYDVFAIDSGACP